MEDSRFKFKSYNVISDDSIPISDKIRTVLHHHLQILEEVKNDGFGVGQYAFNVYGLKHVSDGDRILKVYMVYDHIVRYHNPTCNNLPLKITSKPIYDEIVNSPHWIEDFHERHVNERFLKSEIQQFIDYTQQLIKSI